MHISAPKISKTQNGAEVAASVSMAEGEKTLWFRLDGDCMDMLSDRADAFIVALLIPAMMRGEDITIDATLSPSLAYNLSTALQPLLSAIVKDASVVSVTAAQEAPQETQGNAVLTGFSAGVDSFSVVVDHLLTPVRADFRLTHFLFNDVGSYGTNEQSRYAERLSDIRNSAAPLKLPVIGVQSNLNAFYLDTQFGMTHSLRNVAVAMLLQKAAGKFLYALGDHIRESGVRTDGVIARADPISLPMLSTETFKAIPAGGQYSRLDKTIQISEHAITYDRLDICIDPFASRTPRNCGKCYKCVFTMAALEAHGVLNLYKDCFNISAYKRGRMKQIARFALTRNSYWKEVSDYARQVGFRFPFSIRLMSATLGAPVVFHTVNWIWSSVRRARGLPPRPFV